MIMAIVNEQKQIEIINKDIKRGNDRVAISRLNTLQKQAQNRVYYLNKKLLSNTLSSAERYTVAQQLSIAKKDLSQVKKSVKVIKAGIKDPQHVRTATAFNNLNLIVTRQEAEKAIVRKAQSNASKEAYAKGEKAPIVTLTSSKTTERIQNLMTNLLLNNPDLSMFSADKVAEWNKKLKPLGVDLLSDIQAIFKEGKRYNSGDAFEGVMDIIDEYSERLEINRESLSIEQVRELNQVINEINEAMRG